MKGLFLAAALIAPAYAIDDGFNQPRSTAPAQAAASIQPATSEAILAKVHAINQLEMAVGRLAQRKGQAAEIRRYGKVLEQDHRFGDRQVAGLARAQGIKIQELPPDPDDRQMAQQLQAAVGADFDKQFLAAMRMGHDRAISLLDAARKQTQDPRLNGLIERLVPILRQHQQLAVNLQG